MRFIITTRPGENSVPLTPDAPFDEALFTAYMKFNEEMHKAGVLVGGFYILEVPSLDDAIAWVLRAPTGLGFDDVMEIRPLTSESDLPPEMVELVKKVAPTWSKTFQLRT